MNATPKTTREASDALDALDPDTYDAFARYCENGWGVGPTALSEDDPDELFDALADFNQERSR